LWNFNDILTNKYYLLLSLSEYANTLNILIMQAERKPERGSNKIPSGHPTLLQRNNQWVQI
jgi:hypothetical protein